MDQDSADPVRAGCLHLVLKWQLQSKPKKSLSWIKNAWYRDWSAVFRSGFCFKVRLTLLCILVKIMLYLCELLFRYTHHLYNKFCEAWSENNNKKLIYYETQVNFCWSNYFNIDLNTCTLEMFIADPIAHKTLNYENTYTKFTYTSNSKIFTVAWASNWK